MPVKVQGVEATNWLKKTFGVLGAFTPRLDETIVPVGVVADATRDIAADDVPCVWGYTLAGVVAEFGHISLVNPAGSGILIIVDEIRSSGGAATIALREGARDGATHNPHFCDSRDWEQGGVPQVPISRGMSHTNVAALGNMVVEPFLIAGGADSVIHPRIIIGPNEDITVVTTAVNILLRAVFFYRQRLIVV